MEESVIKEECGVTTEEAKGVVEEEKREVIEEDRHSREEEKEEGGFDKSTRKESSPAVSLKPDLNEIDREEEERGEEEKKEEADQDVVVLSKSSGSPEKLEAKDKAMATPAKDDLLLTLGGSWGAGESKKLFPPETTIKARKPSSSLGGGGGGGGGGGEISLSLGSSGCNAPSASLVSGKMSVRSISNTTTVNTRSFVHNPSCSLTHNSLDDLNSSATQYVAGHENETVSHGGLFGPQGIIQRSRNPFPDSGALAAAAAAHKNNVATTTTNNNNGTTTTTTITRSSNSAGFQHQHQVPPPVKWNSYNLEQYHALFPDLKEGFRKHAGTRRGKHKAAEERSLQGENRVGLYEVAADPVAVVANKLQELPDIFLEDLKKSLTEMLGSVEKRDEFLRLQRILQRRNDLSAENLYVAHRTQLELLVAMKTGIQAFLLCENRMSTAALVEVFLQKRCRNFACQNQLPTDDCDCQFCSQKEGFCSGCMCIACSKFDFMANTCRWVGCDFCLHWCHTDCGIRLSYIKPGSAQGGKQSEMQFVCVACGHASDLFGFVREVFTTYAKDWSAETLRQELDCIQRIFRRSQDSRGKQLCWIAEKMLGKVEGCGDTSELCETIVRFFQEGKIDLETAKVQQQQQQQHGGGEVPAGAVAVRSGSYANAAEEMVAKSKSGSGNGNLQILDRELEAKRNEIAEMQYSRARKRSEIEEMESAIHIKQAEAKMFQLRADEARLEAERLRKIVLAKSEKMEEEYVAKGYKLHVNNAVEKRKRCFVEYQMLEKGLQDFNSMKSKLVTDVHDVLMKMDVMKRNKML
ncbi:OBERON-like protein [Selaginella moellendorffii]|nr:OBERON-like protein [Selaginella moellendorffii]|eukprot:XP_002960421.2 OBERON-like protein [Selaginella moellendorffii]